MKRLFTTAAALTAAALLAGCEDDAPVTPATTIPERQVEAFYNMDIGGSTIVATEFTPAQDSDDTCIYVSPKNTWDGSAQDCFAKAQSGKFYSGTTGPVTYTMSLGGTKMYVLEFSPRTAPHINCVYMSPAGTWTGSTLKCTLR